MNEDRILRNLAAAARGQTPPAIDVADRVVETVGKAGRRGNRLLMWFATASAAAATVIAALAVRFAQPPQDPIAEFVSQMMSVQL